MRFGPICRGAPAMPLGDTFQQPSVMPRCPPAPGKPPVKWSPSSTMRLTLMTTDRYGTQGGVVSAVLDGAGTLLQRTRSVPGRVR
jgi:hypothetical protein